MAIVKITTASNKLLNTEEVAEALNISEKTVRAMCREGLIKAIKLPGGRTWRVPEDEVVRLVRGDHQPREEQEEQGAAS